MNPKKRKPTRLKEIQVKVKTEALLNILAKRNQSLNGFARSLKMSSSFLSLIANGHRSPSPKTRDKIMRKLKVEWDVVFEIIEREG